MLRLVIPGMQTTARTMLTPHRSRQADYSNTWKGRGGGGGGGGAEKRKQKKNRENAEDSQKTKGE